MLIYCNKIVITFAEFRKEIEETVERLKKQEIHLTAKEEALRQKEREIHERERKLEQQFNVVVGVDLYMAVLV